MRFLSYLSVLVTFFAFSCLGNDNVIKVVADPWSPWIMASIGKKEKSGIAIDITNEIFKRLGKSVEITIVPFSRAILEVYDGKKDFILAISKTPDREKKILFTDAIINSSYSLYYRESFGEKGEVCLFNQVFRGRVGVVRDFNYGNKFNESRDKKVFELNISSSSENIIDKYLRKRIDYMVLDDAYMRYTFKLNPGLKFKVKKCKKPISNSKLYFGISKLSVLAKDLSKINSVISDLKKNGVIKAKYMKYTSD